MKAGKKGDNQGELNKNRKMYGYIDIQFNVLNHRVIMMNIYIHGNSPRNVSYLLTPIFSLNNLQYIVFCYTVPAAINNI